MTHARSGSLFLSLALSIAGPAAADEARLYEPKTLDLGDGMTIAYVEAGEGFPIVFVHGLLADHRQWFHNFPYFEDRYRVIGIDLPGHGGSAMVKGYDYSVPALARAVVSLLDELGIARAVLVGNSLGGHVSLYTALAHPDRVERLVLVDPAGARLDRVERTAVSLAQRFDPLRLYPDERVGRFLARAVITRNLSSPIVAAYTRDLERVSRDPEVRARAYEVFTSCLRSVERDHLSDRLAEVEPRTLIVWGSRDLVLRPHHAYELHRGIPHSELVIYESVGHVPSVEVPKAFNARMDRFLEGLGEAKADSPGASRVAGR